mmetsp:Transcript_15201/g.57801  ORF Transcript_15201/g.57801 Transcript_15201/m.57801 type:complete len:279 (-) Transcript_15201:925-1761(-)
MSEYQKSVKRELPPEVLQRFRSYGEILADDDIVAWTKVDDMYVVFGWRREIRKTCLPCGGLTLWNVAVDCGCRYKSSVWRANAADEVASTCLQLLPLPCLWHGCLCIPLMAGCACCLGACTKRAKIDASLYYILTAGGLSTVKMGRRRCPCSQICLKAHGVRNFSVIEMGLETTDVKGCVTQCCHTCFCVPQMPRIEVAVRPILATDCCMRYAPLIILNGIEEHLYFAEELEKVRTAALEDPEMQPSGTMYKRHKKFVMRRRAAEQPPSGGSGAAGGM